MKQYWPNYVAVYSNIFYWFYYNKNKWAGHGPLNWFHDLTVVSGKQQFEKKHRDTQLHKKLCLEAVLYSEINCLYIGMVWEAWRLAEA